MSLSLLVAWKSCDNGQRFYSQVHVKESLNLAIEFYSAYTKLYRQGLDSPNLLPTFQKHYFTKVFYHTFYGTLLSLVKQKFEDINSWESIEPQKFLASYMVYETHCPLFLSNVTVVLGNTFSCPNEIMYKAPPSWTSLSIKFISSWSWTTHPII